MSESGEKKDVTAAKASEHASAKKPYSPPRLRHLGSVRDLTLGSANGSRSDAACLSKSSGLPECGPE